MKSVLFAITLLSAGTLFGQDVNEQYNDLVKNSETFKDYKVIKINELNTFWKNVLDSVNHRDQSITALQNQVEEQKSQIDKQSVEIESLKQTINDLKEQTSSIEFLGITAEKIVFKVLVVAIGIALLAIIGVLLFQLKDKLSLARAKVKDFDVLENKFEEFRKTSLEKQMKLRRDLQTERNKLDEIRSE